MLWKFKSSVILGLLTVLQFIVILVPSASCKDDDFVLTAEDEATYSDCGTKNSYAYLLYKKDGKCYRANTQGPCGSNMVLYPHPLQSNYGVCDCFDARFYNDEEVALLNNKNATHCLEEVRGQIYVPERDRCYSVFAQGPCPAGKWLVLNGTFYPVCARNTCEYSTLRAKVSNSNNYDTDDPLSPRYVFALSSTSDCWETMSYISYCAKSYELRWTPNHWLPQCRYITPENLKSPCPKLPSNSNIRHLRCKPGSRYDYLTKCSRSINPR